MKNKIVKDLMIPISEYETIPIESNLYEAALALDKAQKTYEQGMYPHRILISSEHWNPKDNRSMIPKLYPGLV